ncbi:hypothetical protein NIES4073_77940 [Kalymmatonema gypsitolerans NIES-4073]|nr:hypothetical protein NIES4073_77940 [Scytonema sp. NIES-4073]
MDTDKYLTNSPIITLVNALRPAAIHTQIRTINVTT